MVVKVPVKPIGNQLRSLHMDICWEQNPPSELNVAVRGKPDCVAVVEVVLVRVEENVGVDYHGVRGPLEVRYDRPVVMLSEDHPEPRLDQVQHNVRSVQSKHSCLLLGTPKCFCKCMLCLVHVCTTTTCCPCCVYSSKKSPAQEIEIS